MTTSAAPAIAAIRVAYPAKAFPDSTAALYGRLLADLDPDAVLRSVERLIKGSEFPPTIHAIRRDVAEETLDLPTSEEAWDIALRGNLRGAPPELRGAVDAVGGRWALQHSNHPPTVRAQFLKSYIERRQNAIAAFIGSKPQHALPPAMRDELGPTMRSLPESDSVIAPPVHARWLRRLAGRDLAPPTEAEKAHAIEVLAAGLPSEGDPDPLYVEAERIFVEAGQ